MDTVFIVTASNGTVIKVCATEELADAHCKVYRDNTGCYAWVDERDVFPTTKGKSCQSFSYTQKK